MPSSRIFTFTDPHPYQAAIRTVKVEIFPTTKGKFHAELVQIDLHRLWLQRGRENLPRVCHGPVIRERASIEFLVGADQRAFRHNGVDVSPGEIVVNDWNSAHRRSFAPHHWGSISLTPAHLAAAGRALAGRELTVRSVTHVVRPAPALMTRLLTLHGHAAQLAKTAPERLAHPEVARSLEQTLIHVMIQCLVEGTVIEMDASAQNHKAAISKFEEFLAANCVRPIYLSDICTATGVSESTLRRCCHEHLGMGPIHYLRLRRMHLVRAALMHADPATSTVTGIATDHGFWELGRFSVEYRTLFGESPSATLHRPPDDRRIAQNRPFDLPLIDFA
jgi:AraC-like DNA-binding protein